MRRRILAVVRCVFTIYTRVPAAVPLFCPPFCFCKQPCQSKALLPLGGEPVSLQLCCWKGLWGAPCSAGAKLAGVTGGDSAWPARLFLKAEEHSHNPRLATAAAAGISSWWALLSNPRSVQKRAPVHSLSDYCVLTAEIHEFEDLLQNLLSVDGCSNQRGPRTYLVVHTVIENPFPPPLLTWFVSKLLLKGKAPPRPVVQRHSRFVLLDF